MNILSQNPFNLQKLHVIDSKSFTPAFGPDGQLKHQTIKFNENLYTQDSPKYIGFDKNYEYIELRNGSVDIVNTRDSSILFLKYGAGYTKIGNQIFFLTEPIKDIETVIAHYINWHKGCKGSRCLAEVHRGYEILEDCGGHIP